MEIRRSLDRLISTMGIPTLVKQHHCTESVLCPIPISDRHNWLCDTEYISTPEGRAAERPEGRAVSVTRELDLSLLCRI